MCLSGKHVSVGNGFTGEVDGNGVVIAAHHLVVAQIETLGFHVVSESVQIVEGDGEVHFCQSVCISDVCILGHAHQERKRLYIALQW